jgi:hypothetical protein
MKRIDLHIHTVATLSDSPFDFSLDKLKAYVDAAGLSAIAITNHNAFYYGQFKEIEEVLATKVFPGIEVSVESSHVLLIADPTRADRLARASEHLGALIQTQGASISVEQLVEIFGDLNDYVVIPHYEKKPVIDSSTLGKLAAHVTTGEVDSAKKFIRCIKDERKLVPVLFSDARMSTTLQHFPTRSTYIGCGEVTLSALKATLRDRTKVFLSPTGGNQLFQVLDDGLMASTGLNVFLGDRSSGKTFTLNRIASEHPNVKYIKQFSLVQLDEAQYEREFNSELERRRSRYTEEYLSSFKNVLDTVVGIDLDSGERSLDNYVESLLRSAEETYLSDSFSKTALFSESTFKLGDDKSLVSLIEAVRHLIENVDHRNIIEKHVELGVLRMLAAELIETLWERSRDRLKRQFVNLLVEDIRRQLGIRTSAVQVPDIDLYEVLMDRKKVERFEDIVRALRSNEVIFQEDMQGFRIVARKSAHTGAGELKSLSGKRTAFSDAMKHYESPYAFLRQLMDKPEIPDSELYRFFVKLEYEILNTDGFPVSGGERSEYRLLQEISDAQNYDLLLIDEPESSFDNIFLNGHVNALIRDISRTMPVIVVTHNNTVGASIGADYVLCAQKEATSEGVAYRIFGGYPTDLSLCCADGSTLPSHKIMMDSLEAGTDAYDARRRGYEAIAN